MIKGLEALDITKDQLDGLSPKGLTPGMKWNIKTIEKELKEREYMRRFLDNAYEALEMDITGGLDDDGIWVINIHFKDDTNISIICKDKEEYNFWKEYAGL